MADRDPIGDPPSSSPLIGIMPNGHANWSPLHHSIASGPTSDQRAQASTKIELGNSAQTLANLRIHSSSSAWQKGYARGILRGFLLTESLQSPWCLITIHFPCARSDSRRSPDHIIQPLRRPILPKPHLNTITSVAYVVPFLNRGGWQQRHQGCATLAMSLQHQGEGFPPAFFTINAHPPHLTVVWWWASPTNCLSIVPRPSMPYQDPTRGV